jgi:hypothetical protein
MPFGVGPSSNLLFDPQETPCSSGVCQPTTCMEPRACVPSRPWESCAFLYFSCRVCVYPTVCDSTSFRIFIHKRCRPHLGNHSRRKPIQHTLRSSSGNRQRSTRRNHLDRAAKRDVESRTDFGLVEPLPVGPARRKKSACSSYVSGRSSRTERSAQLNPCTILRCFFARLSVPLHAHFAYLLAHTQREFFFLHVCLLCYTKLILVLTFAAGEKFDFRAEDIQPLGSIVHSQPVFSGL